MDEDEKNEIDRQTEEQTEEQEAAPKSPREEIYDAVCARTQAYLMIAKLFSWPLAQEEIDAIDVDALHALAEETENPLTAEGYNDMYRYLRRKHTGTRQVLNADYTRCFLGRTTYEEYSAQPYASLFLGSGGLLMGQPRMDVNKVYRENCVKLDKDIDLPEDHLAFECEFLAVLNERCEEALVKEDDEEAVKQLEAQKDFLENHVLTWYPRLFNLAGRILETRFYHGVIKMTLGFLEDEPDLIDFLIYDIESLQTEEESAKV